MPSLSHAIVYVSNMDRAIAFYRDTIGLTLRFQSPDWSEFATGGTTLALHIAGAPGAPGSMPGKMPAGACQIGFTVDNVDAFHSRLTAQGVPCLSQPRDEHGIRLANYADPDGLAISVSGPTGGNGT